MNPQGVCREELGCPSMLQKQSFGPHIASLMIIGGSISDLLEFFYRVLGDQFIF